MKKTILVALFFAVFGLFAFISTSCAPVYWGSYPAQASVPCTPGTLGVETIKVELVCPYTGESYETQAVKCPGDDRYRINVVCRLCGYQHYYNIGYWPDDYWQQRYIFYWGWFYPYPYWHHYRPYITHPYPRPGPHPRFLPHPRMYPDRNLRQPRQVRPPVPHSQRKHSPPPPPQFGRPHPPRSPDHYHR